MSYDGSVFAFIGADTKDYEKAMNDVIATTKKAFDDAQKAAINSSNQMIQKIGQLMNELASNSGSFGQKIGQGFKGGLNIALGEIHRIASNIGQRLPEPIQNGLNKVAQAFISLNSKISSALSPIATKMASVGSSIRNAFGSALGKVNNFANQASNTLGGKLISKVSTLSSKISSGLGNAFQQAGSKATNALMGIVNHTNQAASATSNLIKTALGISAAYAGFNFIKNAIGGAITKSADFEARMSSIKAVTGSSADVMRQFHDAAIKAGADTAFSATEAADAIEELAKAGVSTKDILSGGLTGALNLATAGELDLKEAAEIASTALNAFKRDNLSVADAADQLAGAANASATDVHELKYGLSMVAPVAAGLGLTFKDTTNALAVFAQNGLKGSDAGTSLKTMLMNLQPQTKKQYNAMRDLGIVTEDGANKFFTAEGKIKSFAEISQVLKDSLGGLTEQQQAALKTLFGTDAVRAATIAMNEGADGANKMQAEISKVTAAQVAAEKLNNLKGAVEGLSGSFETLQIKIGESVLPLFTTIVKYVDKLVDKFSQSQGIQNFTDAMATINPVLDHFLNGTKLADGVMEKFKSTMLSVAPILSLVGGLLAFGPATKGLTKLTKLLGGLGGKISSFGSIAGGVFNNAAGYIGAFSSKIGGIPGVLGDAASKGISILSMMSQGIASVTSVALAAIGPAAILGLVVAGLGIINNQFGTQIDQLLNTVTTKGPKIIHNLVQGITNAIPSLIASGADLIAKFASAFETMFPVIVNAGVSLIVSLVQGIGQNATSLISSANTVLSTFVSSLLNALPTLLSAGMELLANLSQGILNNTPQMMANAQNTVTTFLTGLGQQMPRIIQNGIQILQNLISGIIQSLPTILQIAVQVITSFIQGLVSNLPMIIQGGIQLITSLVTGLIQNLPQIAQSAAQIVGELITGLAKAVPQLIMGGIELIAKLVVGLIAGLPKIVEAGAKIIFELGKAMLGTIPEAIGSVVSSVGDFFGGMWDWITGKTDEGSEKVKSKTSEMADSVSTKTSEMATNAQANTSAMATNVSTNMDLMNTDTLAKLGTLNTNVDTSFGNLVTSSGINMNALSTNVSNAFTTANATATSETTSMQQNVSGVMDSLNLDTTAKLGTLNTNVDTSFGNLVTSSGINMSALSSNTSASFQAIQSAATVASGQTNAQVSSDFNTLTANANGALSTLQGNTASSFSAVNSSAQVNTSGVSQNVSSNFNSAQTSVDSSMKAITSSTSNGMKQLEQATTSGNKQILNDFTKTFEQVKSTADKGMNNVKSSFENGMRKAVSTSQNANNQIHQIFNTLAGHLQSAGYNAGIGLYNGLASTAGSLYSLAYSIASNIASVMRSALDIHSPSRVMKSIGGFTGEGMYIGMSDWVRKINGVAKQYAMAITDQSYGVDSLITTSASVNNTGLKSSLENLSDDVKHSQLSDTKFEIHNEIVGDKIYTAVKEKEARNRIKDDYFVYE
ncbi:phage tail tape measure protein [Streptococcus anginosus]|uniref:phage tail tape measure protein n=1 Tax=Streptococcus anginosus TaxID=1328 RepID=UPI0020013CD1|nr:phage tail tape measure protein [Streptococcus anginosus]